MVNLLSLIFIRLFSLPSLSLTPRTLDWEAGLVRGRDSQDPSPEGLQTAAARADGFSLANVVELASMHLALSRESGSEASAMRQWTDGVTLSHLEVP